MVFENKDKEWLIVNPGLCEGLQNIVFNDVFVNPPKYSVLGHCYPLIVLRY
jgi:hypothetical protein